MILEVLSLAGDEFETREDVITLAMDTHFELQDRLQYIKTYKY